MLPFARYAICLVVLVTFGCWVSLIIGGSDHPLFSQTTMALAVVSSFLIYLLSCIRTVFATIISLLWTFYYSIRVIVVFFFPEQLDYTEFNVISQNVIKESMLYVSGCSFAVLFGVILANKFKYSMLWNTNSESGISRLLWVHEEDDISNLNKLQVFSRWVACATLVLFLCKLFAMFVVGTGFTGQNWSRQDSIWLRLAYAGNALTIINYAIIIKSFNRLKKFKWSILAVFLNLFGAIFLETKKGAVLMHFIMITISILVIRKSFPRALLKWFLIGSVASCLILFESVNALRVVYLDSVLLKQIEQNSDADRYDIDQSLFKFSKRMGGLDWLVGSVLVGDNVLYVGANLYIDLVNSINTFIPGRLVKFPEYFTVPVSKLIPHFLRGTPLDSQEGGHGELLALVGSFYVFFGPFGCSIGVLFWAFIISLVERTNTSFLAKTFVLYWFGVIVFVGIGFSTGMQMLANLTFICLPFLVFQKISK